MIDMLFWLLFWVIVGAIVVYLAFRIVGLLPVDQTLKNLILALILLIVLAVFVYFVRGLVPLRPPASAFHGRQL